MLQIVNTYRCDFKCDHCLFSCPKKGDLSDHDLLDFISKFNCDDMVNICGGETFLHPNIAWQLSLLSNSFSHVRVVTNGNWITERDLFDDLFNEYNPIDWSKIKIIISDDEYHYEFRKEKDIDALKSIFINEAEERGLFIDFDIFEDDSRDRMINKVQPLGRAKRLQIYDHDPDCMLEDHFFEPCILPDGDIASCCNGKMILGNVRDSYEELNERFINLKKPKKCSECPTRPKIK